MKVIKYNYSAVARSGVQWNTRPFLPPPPTLPWGASQYKMVGIKTIVIIDLKYHLKSTSPYKKSSFEMTARHQVSPKVFILDTWNFN